MKRLLLVTITLLGLIACRGIIYPEGIETCYDFCEERDGVERFDNDLGTVHCHCRNGDYIGLNDIGSP